MPNTTDEDRIMIACGYSASWYPQPPQAFKVSDSAQALSGCNSMRQRYPPAASYPRKRCARRSAFISLSALCKSKLTLLSPSNPQAPLSAKALLTSRTPADFNWLPDAEWQAISQRWGLDDADGIFLPASPGMAPGSGTGKGWDGTGAEPWDCLNVTADEDKIVNRVFNPAAIGA